MALGAYLGFAHLGEMWCRHGANRSKNGFCSATRHAELSARFDGFDSTIQIMKNGDTVWLIPMYDGKPLPRETGLSRRPATIVAGAVETEWYRSVFNETSPLVDSVAIATTESGEPERFETFHHGGPYRVQPGRSLGVHIPLVPFMTRVREWERGR